MVMVCVVCRRLSDINTALRFHTFPSKDRERTEKWCEAMNLEIEKFKNSWRICSAHFSAVCYKIDAFGFKSRYLKDDALPSIIDPTVHEIEENATHSRQKILLEEPTSDEPLSQKRLHDNVDSTDETYIPPKKAQFEQYAHEVAQEKIHYLEKELKKSRIRVSQMRKQIKSFNTLMKDLRRQVLLTRDEVEKFEMRLF